MQCISNNTQIDGNPCNESSLCPENLYVNYQHRTCVNETSCTFLNGYLLYDKTIPECSYDATNCGMNNTKVNNETCMNITQCPDYLFTFDTLIDRTCVTPATCSSKGRYVNFNENTCITW